MPALNLAICWKLWKMDFTQSAGNLLSLHFLGIFRDCSPEFIYCTILGVNYYFIPIYPSYLGSGLGLKHYTKYAFRSKQNTEFAHYITGLIEGDGTIHVPKTERSVKGSLNYPSLQIVFHLKDLALALRLGLWVKVWIYF